MTGFILFFGKLVLSFIIACLVYLGLDKWWIGDADFASGGGMEMQRVSLVIALIVWIVVFFLL